MLHDYDTCTPRHNKYSQKVHMLIIYYLISYKTKWLLPLR